MSTQEEKLKRATVRVLKQSDVRRCPHCILMPQHYRDDGSCRCDDRMHTAMAQWGYKWKEGRWR